MHIYLDADHGTKLARIQSPNTLADSYTRFLPKAQPNLMFITRTPKSKPYIITLPKYTVLIHRRVVYAILLLCWSTPCCITLLSYIQQFHIAELYLILTHGWAIPYLSTLSNYYRFIINRRQFSRNVIGSQSKSSVSSPISTIKNWPD